MPGEEKDLFKKEESGFVKKFKKGVVIRRLRRLLSECTKLRDKCCQKCGRTDRKMDTSHIWPKGTYSSMQFLPDNVKLLCSFPCHNLWWHGSPAESGEWVKDFLGKEKYEKLLKISQQTVLTNRVWLEQQEKMLEEWKSELIGKD